MCQNLTLYTTLGAPTLNSDYEIYIIHFI